MMTVIQAKANEIKKSTGLSLMLEKGGQ